MAPGKSFAPIRVQCREDMPFEIYCEGRLLLVERILERWRDTGSWWEGESEKAFFRVFCYDGGIREIYLDLRLRQWFLYRVYD